MALIIGVDVDETIADLYTEWLRRYNRDFDDNLTPEDMTDWEIKKFVKPEAVDKILLYLQDPDLYKHVKPIPGALEGVKYFEEQGHRVVYVTSCVINQADGKMNWVVDNGFTELDGDTLKDFFAVSDKSLAAVDVLIDDKPKNLTDYFERVGGMTILFNQPHNQEVDEDDFDLRMMSWDDVAEVNEAIEEYEFYSHFNWETL